MEKRLEKKRREIIMTTKNKEKKVIGREVRKIEKEHKE